MPNRIGETIGRRTTRHDGSCEVVAGGLDLPGSVRNLTTRAE
ncbi:MAG: hypothetical protein ACYS0E_11680 [Planctomycetota bacterium]